MRRVRASIGRFAALGPGGRHLKFKLIFIFWANDDAMFGHVTRVCVKINSNQ
jgi:hypothetical protein